MPPGNPSGYGPNGVVWSSDPYAPETSPAQKLINTSLAAGVGVGLLYGAKRYSVGSGNALDFIQHGLRYGGNIIPPGSLLNTFQPAQHLSPFVSGAAYAHRSKFQPNAPGAFRSTAGMSVSPGGKYTYTIGSEFLQTKETADWLRASFGEAAVPTGRWGSDDALQFFGDRKSLSGELWRVSSTGEKLSLISDAVTLAEAQSAEAGSAVPHAKPNTFIGSIAQSTITESGESLTEVWSDGKGSLNRAFARVSGEGAETLVERAMLFPIPSLAHPDLIRRTTLLRAPFAFGMERLNRLGKAFAEQVPFLGVVEDALKKEFNASFGVKSGPGLKMFGRFGLKAGGVLGAGILLQQSDWIRRQGGLGGEVVASGGVSIASTWLLGKLGVRKAALPAGIASFFGQMAMPGFDQGLWQGIKTTAAGIDVATSAAGELLLTNSYRRALEGYLPGVSSMELGALAGIGLAGAAHSGLPEYLLRKYDIPNILPGNLNKYIGIEKYSPDSLPKSVRHHYMNLAMDEARKRGVVPDSDSLVDRTKAYFKMRNKARLKGSDAVAGLESQLAANWEEAQRLRTEQIKMNPADSSLARKIDRIQSIGGDTFVDKAGRLALRTGATAWHSFFGAMLQGESYKKTLNANSLKNRTGRIGILVGAGFVAQQLVTGGLLGSMETASQKHRQYSGQELVPVRRSRWWEAGGTPFAGDDIMYYRPSSLVLGATRARERSIWGEDEDRISPIGKFFRKNFTYELERRQYHDRPYPISSTAFQDIPVIGRALAATIGQYIKPARLMHVSDWAKVGPNGEIQFAQKPEPGGPAYNLGGLGAGTPMSPFDSKATMGYLNYQFRELEGMTGWLKNTIQKNITGSEFIFTGRPELANAGLMTDPREAFWEMNLGGGLFMTEILRRFLPRTRGEKQEYNPIVNNMPSWLPSRYHYGDPYRNLESGWARLPGSGYESIHPELAGLSPESYPLIYRYEILADVASRSVEFRKTRERLYQARAAGQTTPEIDAYMDRIDSQVNEIISYQNFDAVNTMAVQLPGSRLTQGAWNDLQSAARKIAAPAEYLTPMGFRPLQKLMSNRDAIEQYEYERLYGTKMAFWDEPIRDWFRPAFYSAAHMMGWDGKPKWRKDADAISGYFDKLEFIKQMQLAETARAQGDSSGYRSSLYAAAKTRYGVNPQGDPMSIYMSLPNSEKKFFDAFAFAEGKDRKRILEMIPSDQVHLYKALWKRMDMGEQPYPGSSAAVSDAYLTQRMYGIGEHMSGAPMPGTDWIGWHEDVDLDDIKLRYVDSLGKDIHEYDMWERQQRMLQRKPYLHGSENFLMKGPIPNRDTLGGAVYNAISPAGSRPPLEMGVYETHSSFRSNGNFYYNDDRSGDIREQYLRSLEN